MSHSKQNRWQVNMFSNSGTSNAKLIKTKYNRRRRCCNRSIKDSLATHSTKINKAQKQVMAGNKNGFTVPKQSEIEIVELNSDTESDGSDLVVLQPSPRSVVVLSDSDDENKEKILPENQIIQGKRSSENREESGFENVNHFKNAIQSNYVNHPQNQKKVTPILSNCSTIQFQQNTSTSEMNIYDDNRRYDEKQLQEFSCVEYKSSEYYNKQPIVNICDEDDAIESEYCKKRPRCTPFYGDGFPATAKRYIDDIDRPFKESYMHESNDSNENIRSSNDEHIETEESFPSYILPGPAVEHYKSLKRESISTPNAKITVSKEPKCMKLGTIRNSEFINTLKNLTPSNNTKHDSSDESDTDYTFTARDIVEKLLTKKSHIVLDKKTANEMYMNKEFPGNHKEKTLTEEKPLSQTHSTQTSPPLYRIEYNNTQSPAHYVVYAYQKLQGGFGWNEEMRYFYNETWNGENFMLTKILEKMDPDKHLWQICNKDRFNKPMKRVRNFKCNNCCDFGHVRSKCKRPKKPLLCYMCGEVGHFQHDCPNAMCLMCGNKTQSFTRNCKACNLEKKFMCVNCKIYGHSSNNCPDNWRRYHSTTEPNANPNVTISYNSKRSCCVCGARGHLPENCQSAKRFADYPIIFSDIKSHQKSYDDIPVKSSYQSCISFNLLYEPSANFKFKFSENISHNSCYGRFLQAVGLGLKLRNTGPMRDDLQRGSANLKSELICNISNKKLKHDVEGSQNKNITNTNQRNEKNIGNKILPKVTETKNKRMGDKSTNIISAGELNNSIHPTAISNECNLQVQTENVSNEQFLFVESKYNITGQGVRKQKSCYGNEYGSTHITTPQVQYVRNIRAFQSDKLPDYIPLTISKNKNYQNSANISNLNNFKNVNVGSFVVATLNDTADRHSNVNLASLAHLQSEAKIYLMRSHSKYLLSPEGQSFLTKVSQIYGIKARLEWTSVGHVLFISGSQINQEKFHQKLLAKCNSLSEKRITQQPQTNLNIPKRTQVLIRFLKENITELFNNLGDVNTLYQRLKYLEKQHSKCSTKAADKTRRTLNMILFGKAGLLGGDIHLDKLLQYLKILIKEYAEDREVPCELRSAIVEHWKIIFTSHDNGSYANIIQKYNKLACKNRLTALSVDTLLSELK